MRFIFNPSYLRYCKVVIVGIAIASFSALAQAPLDVRIALVIGNSAYVSAPPLTNPSNDAKAMTNILKRLGFTVINVNDGTKEQMAAGIAQMQAALKGQQAVGMLYYAGHGLQQNWRNYMVPVDIKVGRSMDIPKQTIDVDSVIEAFKMAGTRMNIIVLDACRDNPFGDKTSNKGLAQIIAPPNTYIAFATAPGNVAQDGTEKSGNGLFTEYIIKELQKPAPIEDMFRRVRLQVRKQSNGTQIPWDSSSLENEFAFNDGAKHTFNPDDLVKEAQAAKAKEEELQKQIEQAKEQEKKLAQEREQEKLKLVKIQKMQEIEAKMKAETESKERDKQLKLAQEKEQQKANELILALEKAKLADAKRQQEIQLAKANAEEGVKQFKALKNEDKAAAFAQQKADWDKIKDSKSSDDFYSYLNKYPNGLISQQATFRLNQLAEAKIAVQPTKDGILQKPGEKRFRVGDEFTTVTKDNYSGNVIRQNSGRVEKIENGLVYIKYSSGNVAISMEDGSEVEIGATEGGFKFDPPEVRQPGGDFQIGLQWEAESIMTFKSTQSSTRRRTTGKVVGIEDLTINNEIIRTFKVETQSLNVDWKGNVKQQRWYLPGFGIALKLVRQTGSSWGPGYWETTEVTSFKLGKG